MFAKVVSYSFSHNGATYCFLTVHLSGHNKALLLLFSQYIHPQAFTK